MPAQISKLISIGTQAIAPGPEIKKSLSIELLPDGFSFCVLDNQQFKYLALESFRSKHPLSPEQWSDVLDQLMKENVMLSASYQNVNISWFSTQLILIPGDLFSMDNKDNYYQFANNVSPGYSVANDWLNNLDAYGLYSFPEVLKNKFDEFFPGHRMRHAGTVLIESLMASLQLNEWNADIVLHVRRKHFDVLLINENRLQFFNSFRYEQFGDLMYYLFFVLEQFNLDANALDALLIGEISLDSERFHTLSRYFRKVGFISRSDIYRYNAEFDALPHHYYYTLLNINSCG